jgi:hypothetical protein
MDGWIDRWICENVYVCIYTHTHTAAARPRPGQWPPRKGRGLSVPTYLAHRALAERLFADDHPRRRLEPVPLHASVLPGYSRDSHGVLPSSPYTPLPWRTATGRARTAPRARAIPLRVPLRVPCEYPCRVPLRVPCRVPCRVPLRGPLRGPLRVRPRVRPRVPLRVPPASTHLRERVGLVVRLVLQLDHALGPPLARLRQRLGGRPQV